MFRLLEKLHFTETLKQCCKHLLNTNHYLLISMYVYIKIPTSAFRYGSGSHHFHWCNSPLILTPINSECNAAICENLNWKSFSGHGSNSSEIHNGNPVEISFFFESVSRSHVVSSREFWNQRRGLKYCRSRHLLKASRSPAALLLPADVPGTPLEPLPLLLEPGALPLDPLAFAERLLLSPLADEVLAWFLSLRDPLNNKLVSEIETIT